MLEKLKNIIPKYSDIVKGRTKPFRDNNGWIHYSYNEIKYFIESKNYVISIVIIFIMII